MSSSDVLFSPNKQKITANLVPGKSDVLILRGLTGVQEDLFANGHEQPGSVQDVRIVVQGVEKRFREYRMLAATAIDNGFEAARCQDRARPFL